MITNQDIIKKYHDFTQIKFDLTEAELRVKNKQLFDGVTSTLACDRHLEVYKRMKVIPKYCFGCYKVLITPRNVIELFKLHTVFEDPDFPVNNSRKCMVEQRPYCGGSYKGYIYCEGLEEAEQVQKIVRKIITENISPQVSVSVKRGCSEYAKLYPDYEKITPVGAIMQYRSEWQVQEDYFDKHATFELRVKDANDKIPCVSIDGLTTYPREKILCMQHWLRYAATIGDMSYLEISGAPALPLAYLKQRPPFINTIPLKKD